jgi:hypothetical protein
MSEHITVLKDQPQSPPALEPIAFSNSIRLSARQWIGVILFAVVLVNVAPFIWQCYEEFTPDPDYRIPHELSQDYWLYERCANLAADRGDTLLIGDSVIWGEYVKPDETLSAYLNDKAGRTRHHANLGLDGAHPLALLGLARHYTSHVANCNVVLECNPLWLTSERADLQDDKKVNEFNHPRLVPQFSPPIPSYREEISPRLGILVEQRSAFTKWTRHLQQAYYEQGDMPSWTIKHPYENPLEPLTHGLPEMDRAPRHLQRPWYESKMAKQDYPWVDLDESLQWHAFQEVVEVLRARGNRVFVIVGPFNEHMLTLDSLARYQKVKTTITAWLKANDVPHLAPAALPSRMYGDASHPLPAGYAALAELLREEEFFK